MELSRSGRLWRLLIKRYLYAMLSLREAACIFLGRSKPMIRFTVEADPPSVYFNFRVRPDRSEFLSRLGRREADRSPRPSSARPTDGRGSARAADDLLRRIGKMTK